MAVGELARQTGSGDAQAWRVVELARALLAIPPGRLADVPASGLPADWFESAAVRTAAGWNRWQDETFISREAWAELVDAVAVRDTVVGLEGAEAAASGLKRRAAAAGYRLTPVDAARDRSDSDSTT